MDLFKIKFFIFANKLNSKIKDYNRHLHQSKKLSARQIRRWPKQVMNRSKLHTNDLGLTH
jgi:hypothetical protein